MVSLKWDFHVKRLADPKKPVKLCVNTTQKLRTRSAKCIKINLLKTGIHLLRNKGLSNNKKTNKNEVNALKKTQQRSGKTQEELSKRERKKAFCSLFSPAEQ